MSISTEKHQGKTIHIMDYSHCQDEEEFIEALYLWADYQEEQPSRILALSDVTSLVFTERMIEKTIELSERTFIRKEEKKAIIGISGIKKKQLLEFTEKSNNPLFAFPTKKEAIKYLLSKD